MLFDLVGAWRFCPKLSCGRGRACRGGDGPPCYRADRKVLSTILFITWMRMYWGWTEEEWQDSFMSSAPRYAAGDEAPPTCRRPAQGRARKASGAKGAGVAGRS